MMLTHPTIVTRLSKNHQVRQRWVFVLHGCDLILERYFYEIRGSKGEDYRTTRLYDAQSEPYGSWQWVPVNEVPWDEDLEEEVVAEFVRPLRVLRNS